MDGAHCAAKECPALCRAKRTTEKQVKNNSFLIRYERHVDWQGTKEDSLKWGLIQLEQYLIFNHKSTRDFHPLVDYSSVVALIFGVKAEIQKYVVSQISTPPIDGVFPLTAKSDDLAAVRQEYEGGFEVCK